MTISSINPASSAVLAPKDEWGFIIDDTYTSLTITVSTASGNELAYSTALGGAQAGYTVVVTDLGSTHQFAVVRDAGLSDDPTTITVVENETGSEATTEFTYYLTNTGAYTEGMQPYTNPYEGTLIVTDNGVSVRTDTGWLDFTGATVTDLGNGKVRVAFSAGSGGGGDKLGEFVLQSGTGSDVGTGQFRFTLAPPTFGALVYFNVTDNNAEDLTAQLALPNMGTSLMVRDVINDEYAIIPSNNGVSSALPTSGSGAGGAWRSFSIDSAAVLSTAGFAWTYGRTFSLHVLSNFDQQWFGEKVIDGKGGGAYVDIMGDQTTGEWTTKNNNWTGTLDPGVADDGYSISSFWWNENNGSLWVCTGNATGAAIWKRLYASATNDIGGTWTFASTAGTPNANGEVEPNNADSDLVTSINIFDSDALGTDYSSVFSAVVVGDSLIFDRGEGAIDVNYLVTGTPVDNTTYWTFPVTETLATNEDYSGVGKTYDNGAHIGAEANNTDHGALTGLADDDHTQYALADGSRGGDISLGHRSLGNTTIGVTASGKFDTNNATTSSITSIRVNILNDMQNIFDNVHTTGTLLLRDLAAPTTNWVIFDVTAITDNPSYGKTFTVTHIAEAGTVWGTAEWGIQYIADADGAGGGGGSNSGMGQFAYVTGGGAPASLKFTANTDALSTVTTLNISDVSAVDTNFSIAFGNVKVGDYIIIRDNAGGAAHGTYLVSAAVDNTTYWAFTVSTGNVSGTFVATNSYDLYIMSGADVRGPSVNVANQLVQFDGTTGKLIKDPTTLAYASGELRNSSTTAALRLKERAAAPTGLAGNGHFWVKDDAPSIPMFQQDDDTEYKIGRSYLSLTQGGRFTGTALSTWYSYTAQTINSDAGNMATAAGTATDPAMTWDFLGHIVPGAGTIIRVYFSYTINVSGDDGFIHLYKARPTDGTTTVVKTSVTSIDIGTLAPSTSVINLADSGALTESVIAHDRLRMWKKNGATTVSTSSVNSVTTLIELV